MLNWMLGVLEKHHGLDSFEGPEGQEDPMYPWSNPVEVIHQVNMVKFIEDRRRKIGNAENIKTTP